MSTTSTATTPQPKTSRAKTSRRNGQETATTPQPSRAEISRENGKKSQGPVSEEGKTRSKYNAVTHGLTAKTLVLSGEDPQKLQRRFDAWTADLQPQNSVELFLVEQAVQASWKLERVDRAELARLAYLIQAIPAAHDQRAYEQALALG